MSASNIGISQLEALQLRNLLGPSGIGKVTYNDTGVISQNLPLDNGNTIYISPFSVPSGTGIMRYRFQSTLVPTQGQTALIYSVQILIGDKSQSQLVYGLPAGQSIYDGFMLYDNPSNAPAVIRLVLQTNHVSSVTLTNFQAQPLSFGPYVQQD
jgi:hypothetical protein